MLTARHCFCVSSTDSSCQQLNLDFDRSMHEFEENRRSLSRSSCALGPRASSMETCLTSNGRRLSQPVDILNTGESSHSMLKSASMPNREIPFVDTPDPFPELSRNALTPVSARLYWPERPSPSSSSSPLLGQDDSSSHEEGSPKFNGVTDNNRSQSKVINQKLYVQFYNDDQSCHSIEIKPDMTVSDVCDRLVALNHMKHDIQWTIVEHIEKFNLERSLEDHELIFPIYRAWDSSCSDNRFYFRKDFTKYELFRHPNQYFPEQMVDIKMPTDESLGFMTRYERYKNVLLQNLLANQSMPDIQGYLHIREGKWSWKKYYCVLRTSGLYFSTKGSLKDPRYLVLISHLNEVDIYVVRNAKKTVSSPNQFCFCLKPPCNVTECKQLKLFCAEDEQSRLCWMTGMRFIKFGSQLRENFRAKVKVDNRLQSIENKNNKLQNDVLYVKNRVAMDFSGDRGHVVDDPNEALCVAIEEGHHWRLKAHRQHAGTVCQTSVRPSDDAVSRPAVLDIHLTQPWFYGNLSRQEAVRLVEQQGLVNGVFVVRKSQSMPGVFVLTFAHNHKVKHCPIHRIEDKDQVYYTLDNGATKFMDLIQLIDFYQLNAGALPTELTHHVTKQL